MHMLLFLPYAFTPKVRTVLENPHKNGLTQSELNEVSVCIAIL